MVKMKTENMILAFVGLQTQELSQVKSETAPPHEGQRESKERGTFNQQETTKEACLRQPQYEQISAPASHQNLKSLYRGLQWVQSCVSPIWSHQHTALSMLYPCKWLDCRNSGQKAHPKDRGQSEGLLIAEVQLVCQPVVTSSQ